MLLSDCVNKSVPEALVEGTCVEGSSMNLRKCWHPISGNLQMCCEALNHLCYRFSLMQQESFMMKGSNEGAALEPFAGLPCKPLCPHIFRPRRRSERVTEKKDALRSIPNHLHSIHSGL